jgi:hypothetical protein
MMSQEIVPPVITPVAVHIVEAVQYGHLQIFLDHIQSHTQGTPFQVIDAEGCSLLHWAAINNRVSYIHLLLDKGTVVPH